MAGKFWRRACTAAVCGGLVVPLSAVSASAAPAASYRSAPVVVVSGLNNPRQLSLVHNDVLLIAEAGRGGTVATVSSPEGGKQGLGYTGSVSAVLAPAIAHKQAPHRIITGLLSAASATAGEEGPVGGSATGPDGVAARSLNRIAVIDTPHGTATPAAARKRDGQLLRAAAGGPIDPIANITAYEKAHDPDHMGVDSNPYAVLNYRSGWLVADAAGNDILRVDRLGHISVFHVFPNIKTGPCAKQTDPPPFPGCNFVPTSLATDRWGNVYVGSLGSLVPGQGSVVELNQWGDVRKVWSGFTSVSGVAVGSDGAIYVSQLLAPEAHPANSLLQGVLTRIKGGARTNMDIPFPSGIAVDYANNVFVSVFSVLPSTGAGIPSIPFDTSGQVWRLRF